MAAYYHRGTEITEKKNGHADKILFAGIFNDRSVVCTIQPYLANVNRLMPKFMQGLANSLGHVHVQEEPHQAAGSLSSSTRSAVTHAAYAKA
ncbi:MAG: hypothetical protein ABFD92_13955 [Planctomycetaceae bacterium]